jgi:hypothetical protein
MISCVIHVIEAGFPLIFFLFPPLINITPLHQATWSNGNVVDASTDAWFKPRKRLSWPSFLWFYSAIPGKSRSDTVSRQQLQSLSNTTFSSHPAIRGCVVYILTETLSSPRNKTCVRLEVFTTVTMKNAVVWDVAPRRSCGCSHLLWFFARGFFCPEDGGDTFLRNVGSHKIYTAPHPRRRHCSKQMSSEVHSIERNLHGPAAARCAPSFIHRYVICPRVRPWLSSQQARFHSYQLSALLFSLSPLFCTHHCSWTCWKEDNLLCREAVSSRTGR